MASTPVVVHLARGGSPSVTSLVVASLGSLALIALAHPSVTAVPVTAAILLTSSVALLTIGAADLLLLTASLAAWALVLGVRVAPGWPALARAARPAIAPIATSSVLLLLGGGRSLAVALLAFGLGVIALTVRFPRPAARAVGVGERVGTVVGAAVQAVLMVPVAVLLTVGWVCHRIVRFDPLAQPTERHSRWVERDGSDRHPERLYASVRVAEPRSWRTGLHRVAFRAIAVAASFALLVGALLSAFRPLDLGPVDLLANLGAAVAVGDAIEVLGQDDDWEQVVTENGVFVRHARFDPVTTFTFADLESRWVNVRDGKRRTWAPPACDCRRLKVWVFGGSVAFGYYQKDEQTPPSHLAKQAWDAGIALDIENYAMPAFLLGQEARLFGHLLTTEEPPDLVIFYDGANEVAQQNERAAFGEGADSSEMVERSAEERIESVFTNRFADSIDALAGRGGEPRSDRTPPPRELGALAADRYLRNVDLVRRLAESDDIAVAHFWQPIAATAPRELSAPTVLLGGDNRQYWIDMYAGARARLPSDVVDLSDVLDVAPRPVFADIFHTNDLGAEIVGERLYQELEPLLRDLAAG